jgi:microsomal epoxide hydrolase
LIEESILDSTRKTTEDRINSFPQWTAEVEGLNIHFVGLFSENPDAIPILLIHGWPGKVT